MNSQEAKTILGVDESASMKDIDKAFKKKAAKLHPDVCKADDAESQFKKLNEAYQFLKNPPAPSPRTSYSSHSGFNPMRDFFRGGFGGFGGFGGPRGHNYVELDNAVKVITLTFAESVLGCKKSITFERQRICTGCHGQCEILKETCSKCQGQGWIFSSQNQNSTVVVMNSAPCPACNRKGGVYETCSSCDGQGFDSLKQEVTLEPQIPAGVRPGDKIKLSNAGHEYQNLKSDLILVIQVTPDSELKLDGFDVVSEVKLSLLEALEGTVKEVKSVRGTQKLKIPEGIKNNIELVVKGAGVPNRGHHRFKITIDYPEPEQVQKIISLLKETS